MIITLKGKYYMLDEAVDCSNDLSSIILHVYAYRFDGSPLFTAVFSFAILRLAFYQAHTRGRVQNVQYAKQVKERGEACCNLQV